MRISIGHLSQIERNQAQLSVASLKAISDALGVQIGYFFDEAGQRISAEHKIVVREGARQKLRYAKTGVLDELLVPDLNGPIEMLMSYYLPGADTEFYSHVGVEAGLVVQGELELTVGNDVFILKEGDSFTFRSTEMHRSRNLSDKEVRVVWVITPPAF
ncbi:MAG: XRE family transcriptional regulator [Pseudomonadota bacterium]